MDGYFYQRMRFSPYIWNGLCGGRGHGLYFDPSDDNMMKAFRKIISIMQEKNVDYKVTYRSNAKKPYYRIYVSEKTYNKMGNGIKRQILDISIENTPNPLKIYISNMFRGECQSECDGMPVVWNERRY